MPISIRSRAASYAAECAARAGGGVPVVASVLQLGVPASPSAHTLLSFHPNVSIRFRGASKTAEWYARAGTGPPVGLRAVHDVPPDSDSGQTAVMGWAAAANPP